MMHGQKSIMLVPDYSLVDVLIQGVLSILATSTVALAHRKLETAGTSLDTRDDEDSDKRNVQYHRPYEFSY